MDRFPEYEEPLHLTLDFKHVANRVIELKSDGVIGNPRVLELLVILERRSHRPGHYAAIASVLGDVFAPGAAGIDHAEGRRISHARGVGGQARQLQRLR